MGTFLYGKGFPSMYGHLISTTVSLSTIPSGETPSHRLPSLSDVTHNPVLLNSVHCISLMYVAMPQWHDFRTWNPISLHHLSFIVPPVRISFAYSSIASFPLHPNATAARLPFIFPLLASLHASVPCL